MNSIPIQPWLARILVVVFYLTGLIGLLIPQSFILFRQLIPFALLFSAFALVLFHEGTGWVKTTVFFLLIFLAGYFTEVAGVHTGLIFGEYRYGQSLGLKWLEVPLIIGLNWAMLTYMTASLTDRFPLPVYAKIVSAALLMVSYDLVLEQAAPGMDMWTWSGDRIPLLNYLSWFFISLLFHVLLKIFRIETRNKLAALLFICQFLFFLCLVIFGFNQVT
jgi:bisanhydrobacterioruberin hydratase